MKNIFFILPNQHRFSGNFSTFTLPGFNTSHLGTLMIGEMLRQRGYHVKIFEEKITPVKISQIKGADLVGISIQTCTAPRGYELAYQIRKRLKIPVVIGGVHATLNTEEALKWADFVIRNEGEYAMLDLVEALEEGGGFDDILGLSYRQEGESYHNPQRPFIKDLDALPYPNWDLIENMNRYLHTPVNHLIYLIQASRGCPFNCTFCSITPTFGKPFRFRSVENVIHEIKYNRMPSQKFLFFYDDNLVANRKYLKNLLSAIIDNDCVPFAWHSQMRADASEDDEMMELMERTNFALGTFGFESINPKTLEFVQKGQNLDLIESCIEKVHDMNAMVNGFFVFGSDTDTVETIHDTVQFAINKELDFVGFMPLTPFPGTPFFEEIRDRVFSQNWELYDVQHVVFYPKQMTPLELYKESLKAYNTFYRPTMRLFRPRKGLKVWNLFFFIWPLRGHILYRKELIANRKYMRYLKSLPPYDLDKKIPIPEFKESRTLHYILSNAYFKNLWTKLTGRKYGEKAKPIEQPIIKT